MLLPNQHEDSKYSESPLNLPDKSAVQVRWQLSSVGFEYQGSSKVL